MGQVKICLAMTTWKTHKRTIVEDFNGFDMQEVQGVPEDCKFTKFIKRKHRLAAESYCADRKL